MEGRLDKDALTDGQVGVEAAHWPRRPVSWRTGKDHAVVEKLRKSPSEVKVPVAIPERMIV